MEVFLIGHFEVLSSDHHFLTRRTSIPISALFAQWIVIKFISVIFSVAARLIASLGKTVIQLKLMDFNEVIVASNAIE